MDEKLTIFNLILNAGFVVQIIMLVLIIMSIYSWTIIFSRKNKILIINKQLKAFNHKFINNDNLNDLYQLTNIDNDAISQIFNNGYVEFINTDNKNNIERAYRKMNITMNDNIEKLEKHISSLAIIASSSPYIGLFGTVWGIMHSFLSLSSVKQATIAIVAPGIAEALIATAFGLFAAIPATISYNSLHTKIEKIAHNFQLIVENSIITMQRT